MSPQTHQVVWQAERDERPGEVVHPELADEVGVEVQLEEAAEAVEEVGVDLKKILKENQRKLIDVWCP